MPRAASVAGAVVAFFVAFGGWVVGGTRGTTVAAVSDIVLLALTVPVIALTGLAARSERGRIRLAWLALTVGLFCWAVGQAIWAFYELVLHKNLFPSPADAAYLVFPVAACVGLLVLPGKDAGPFRARSFLDGLIVAASLFLVGRVMVLGPPTAQATPTGSPSSSPSPTRCPTSSS